MTLTQPTADRVMLVAYAYEVIVGDIVVDTWEETERPVTAVLVTTKSVTLTFDDATSETTTQKPGYQKMYDVSRLLSELKDLSSETAAP